MTILDIANLHRSYNPGVSVLDGIDLQIGQGEVVGLLGANGAGKTTLLRLALGALQPHEGEVRVFGLDPFKHPVEVKQRLGYVSEDQSFPTFMRVHQLLKLHEELFPSWDNRVATRLCEKLDLNPRKSIGTLSKGQARWVAIICAIAHRPEFLLLDEPAGGFDPAARREFLQTALDFLSETGATILFSSHHMEDIERLAHRVVFLQNKKVHIDRNLDDLREATTLLTSSSAGFDPDLLRRIQDSPECLSARIAADELRAVFDGKPEEVEELLQTDVGNAFDTPPHISSLSLEDLFIELTEGGKE